MTNIANLNLKSHEKCAISGGRNFCMEGKKIRDLDGALINAVGLISHSKPHVLAGRFFFLRIRSLPKHCWISCYKRASVYLLSCSSQCQYPKMFLSGKVRPYSKSIHLCQSARNCQNCTLNSYRTLTNLS